MNTLISLFAIAILSRSALGKLRSIVQLMRMLCHIRSRVNKMSGFVCALSDVRLGMIGITGLTTGDLKSGVVLSTVCSCVDMYERIEPRLCVRVI